MSSKIVEIDARFNLNQGALKLSVKLGDGQPGSYNIFLDNELLKNSAVVDLGDSSSLSGKVLSIVATIRDVRKETNWTSVSLTLTDRNQTVMLGPYSRKVDKDFGKIIYSIDIDLL